MASFPTFPSIDLSKLDLSKLDLSKFDLSKFDLSKFDLSKFDVSKLDLSKLDLSRFEVAGVDTDKVLGLVRDAAYVVIGFGVLSVQQVQVRRRELRATLEQRASRLGIAKDQLDDVIAQLEARLGQLDQRLEGIETKLDDAVESVIDAMGERLPEQAGALLGQAHEAAKAARKQVRGLLVSAA